MEGDVTELLGIGGDGTAGVDGGEGHWWCLWIRPTSLLALGLSRICLSALFTLGINAILGLWSSPPKATLSMHLDLFHPKSTA